MGVSISSEKWACEEKVTIENPPSVPYARDEEIALKLPRVARTLPPSQWALFSLSEGLHPSINISSTNDLFIHLVLVPSQSLMSFLVPLASSCLQ